MVYRITVEVPFALCLLGFQLLGNVILNLNTYKVCYNILNYPEEDCLRLGRYTDNATQELEGIVQPYAGTLTQISEMVPVALPIVVALMVGSWSDKHGRRPVLLFILICMTLGLTIGTILLCFKEINPWFMMLGSIPSVFCGGAMTFFMVVMSYLNDTATPENRVYKMVSMDVIQVLTSLVGSLSSSHILYATNYPTVYGICVLLMIASFAYVYFFCPESIAHKSEEKPTFANFFQWSNVTDLFKVALRKQENGKRTVIILLMLSQIIVQFVGDGEGTPKTLYLRNKFSWTLEKNNNFGAACNLVFVTSTVASTYFLYKKLQIRETILIILALTSAMANSLLFALGQTEYYIYASAAAGIFGGLSLPMIRTLLSKMIAPEEMGKIYSLVMVVNNLSMFVASLMYVQIYTATIDTHPETFNYVSFGFYAVCAVMGIVLMVLEKRFTTEELNRTNKSIL